MLGPDTSVPGPRVMWPEAWEAWAPDSGPPARGAKLAPSVRAAGLRLLVWTCGPQHTRCLPVSLIKRNDVMGEMGGEMGGLVPYWKSMCSLGLHAWQRQAKRE